MSLDSRGCLVLVAAAACLGSSTQNETAASGSPVSVGIPVGPVPGPGATQLPRNPLGNDDAIRIDGHKLFLQYNCAGCHGDHGGGGMGPSLRDESWLYGSTDAQIFNSITEGRAHGMPAWGKKL